MFWVIVKLALHLQTTEEIHKRTNLKVVIVEMKQNIVLPIGFCGLFYKLEATDTCTVW